MFDHVNRNDIPFIDNDLGNGRRDLPIPLLGGNDPIYHSEAILGRTSVNTTLDGHTFHPGTVTHTVSFSGGYLNYTVTGAGQEEMANLIIS